MRQVNFVLIFTACLLVVLFGLENPQLVNIQFWPGFKIQAPLCIELLLSTGIGAVIAWSFSLWNQMQIVIQSQETIRQNSITEERIQELESDVIRYKAEIQQFRLPPASETTRAETIDAIAE
jgi:lipopolysaccharide assembly protein A